MRLFTRNTEREVQSFILKVVNNNCPELEALVEGQRLDGRANLTLVVMVVPIKNEKLLVDKAFATVTKEFSTTGISLVLDEPKGLGDVVLGFRWEREMVYVHATAKHLNPIGGGFYQLGFKMNRVVHAGDQPELKAVTL